MADQTELALVKNVVKTMAVQPVVFDDDYQAPPHLALRRVPVLSVRTIVAITALSDFSSRFRFHLSQNVNCRLRRQQVRHALDALARALIGKYSKSGRHQHYVQILEASLRLLSPRTVHRHHLRH